jgi:hypothetical protein
MKPTILVICGATAADIKSELGLSRDQVRKVQSGESVGTYGDYVCVTTDADAVLMKMKYPKVVRII